MKNKLEKRKIKIPRNILLLGLVSMFIDMSTEMVYPLMPLYLLALGTTPVIIGIIEGITEALATVLKVFAGYISDKTHKKKWLAIAGYSAAFFYKIGIIFSTTWVGILCSKIVDRTGKGLRTAPRDSLIAESGGKALGKNYGIHKMFDMLGSSLGVLLAFIFITQNAPVKTVFYWSVLPAILGVLTLYFVKEKNENKIGLKPLSEFEKNELKFEKNEITSNEITINRESNISEDIIDSNTNFQSNDKENDLQNLGENEIQILNESTQKAENITQSKFSLRNIKLDKKIWFYLIALTIFSIGNSSNAFLLLKAQNSGVTVTNTLLLYLLFNIVSSGMSIPLGKLSDKVGRRKIIAVAYCLYGVIYVCFGIFTKTYSIALLFGFYGLYNAMISGTEKALIVEISPSHLKGTVLGLQGMAQGLGLFASSLIAGLLWQYVGTNAPFFFGGALAFVSAIAMLFILNMPDRTKIKAN